MKVRFGDRQLERCFMETEDRVESNAAVPPGLFLRDELRARRLTQKDLAVQMGTTVKVVREICQGKREITADAALDLERVLGIKAYLWMNLESDYRLALARQRRKVQVQATAA